MITFDDVTFSYDKKVQAIENVTMHISRGQTLGLLGHNGAGKTTTLRLILGLLRPQSGCIKVSGLKPGNPNLPRALISYMPELSGIYEKLTGFQNLEFRARAAKVDRTQIRPRSEKLLDRLGLLKRGHEKAGYLSKGLKQRLSLACALIRQPRLLLLDELSEGIQPSLVSGLARYLVEMADRDGLHIFLVEQNVQLVRRFADRCGVLEKGRIVAEYDREGLRAAGNLERHLAL